MVYNLGDYRYKNFEIYKRTWWCFYKCIDKGPYSRMIGIRKVNELCGIKEKPANPPNRSSISPNNQMIGKFLVKFKNPESFFLNDPLPATIEPYKNRLYIQWDNFRQCVIDASKVDVYELECKEDSIIKDDELLCPKCLIHNYFFTDEGGRCTDNCPKCGGTTGVKFKILPEWSKIIAENRYEKMLEKSTL